MMGLIYLAILLAAVGFAIIAVYFSFVLYRLSKTMKVVNTSLVKVEETVNNMTPQLRDSLNETDMLIDDIQTKLDATDSVFDTVENIGQSVHNLADAFDKKSKQVTEEEMEQSFSPFARGMKWSEVASQLFKKAK